jgi:nucleoside-diphosphate-sugar epimerase
MRAIIIGSTGGIGRWIVKTLAYDNRISSITALTRSIRSNNPAGFFRVEENLYQQKIKQVLVNVDQIDETTFKGHHIGFSGLGIYTALANKQPNPEEYFRKIEIEDNLNIARAMLHGGVKRYSYLSGAGASQNGSRIMFARVKGDAERRLQNDIGFERCTVVRPAAIVGRGEDASTTNYLVPDWIVRMIMPNRYVVEAEDIARAMVHSTLCRKDIGSKCILENMDIKKFALEYKKECEKM